MEVLILIGVLAIIGLLVLVLLQLRKQAASEQPELDFTPVWQEQQRQLRALQQDLTTQMQTTVNNLGSLMTQLQRQLGDGQTQVLQSMSQNLHTQLQQFEARLRTMESTNLQSMEQVRTTVARQLQGMQADQKKSLDEMRGMVDEKLTRTLEESLSRSFQRVSKQLEDVYKGLGEMQTLASGVGDLKKVLSEAFWAKFSSVPSCRRFLRQSSMIQRCRPFRAAGIM